MRLRVQITMASEPDILWYKKRQRTSVKIQCIFGLNMSGWIITARCVVSENLQDDLFSVQPFLRFNLLVCS